jgi:hypothetical protein
VTVILENQALAEFAVIELISTKTASGASCSTCGGCTTKRRAGAAEDNAKLRTQAAARKSAQAKTEPVEDMAPAKPATTSEQGHASRVRRRRR